MKNIKLMLCSGTRTSINAILTDFATLLNGQETTDEDRLKLQEQSNELIKAVSKVKRFKEDEGEPRIKIARKSSPTQPNLEIDYELKREILNLLQKNLDYSIDLFDEISDEMKQSLIGENESLIKKLKALKCVSPRVSILPEKTLSGTLTSRSTSSKEGLFWLLLMISFH